VQGEEQFAVAEVKIDVVERNDPPEIPSEFAGTSVIQVDDDSVTFLPGFGIRDVDASEIHPFEVLITATHGEVIIDDTNGYDEISFELLFSTVLFQSPACVTSYALVHRMLTAELAVKMILFAMGSLGIRQRLKATQSLNCLTSAQ
jgi:hypothetical protein